MSPPFPKNEPMLQGAFAHVFSSMTGEIPKQLATGELVRHDFFEAPFLVRLAPFLGPPATDKPPG
jgi:hypothetical protein